MASMSALVKQRAVIKGKLTRAINSTEEYSSNVAAIDMWLENATQLEQNFEKVQAQIEELATPPEDGEQDPQELERAQFEKSIFDFMLKLREKRGTLVLGGGEASDDGGMHSNATSNITNHKASAPRVRLPKINLPIFNGDWKQWPSFYQLFTKLVDDEPAYTAIEKFFHLKSHLSGEAAERIQSIEITEENYQDALEALKSRYDNQRLIVMKHLKIIFELPIVTTDSQLRSLVDAFNNSLRALAAQGLPTDQWDAILLYLVSSKLGPGIRRQWEITLEASTQLPSLTELVSFLEQRAAASEVMAATSNTSEKRTTPPFSAGKTIESSSKTFKPNVKYTHLNTQDVCPICKGPHFAYQCRTYANSVLAEREKLVAKHHLCGNCLNPRHATSKCRSSKCKKCGNAHHTSLHKEPNSTPLDPNAKVFSGLTSQPQTTTFLPTAYVLATNNQFKTHVRMVIDCASQCTLITEKLAKELKLKPTRTVVSMEGIGGAAATSPQFAANLIVKSRHSPYELEINAKILPMITCYRPTLHNDLLALIQQPGVPLADDFSNDLPVDILLGAEYWASIMQAGKLEISPVIAPLLNSSFGWLVSGCLSLDPSSLPTPESCCFTLEAQLRKFWELEDVAYLVPSDSSAKKMTPEEQFCEQNYVETTSRDSTGRYIVTLPFNDQITKLGESRQYAERQFLQIERRMQREPTYREKYHEFMREYENLGHMTAIDHPGASHYFLPHHAVIPPDNPSKFRVVFNGSRETSTGISLNDALHIGPTIQNDINTILLRFRRHKFAVTADVEKMYRQVLLKPIQRMLQLILWRFSPQAPLRVYQLNTVTYGTRSAAFLATRTRKQLVLDEGAEFPLASAAILEDEYIDDVLSGASTLEEAHRLIAELQELSSRGHFHLRKWASNAPEALIGLPEQDIVTQYAFDKENPTSKVLGMLWDTKSDEFIFHSSLPEIEGELTKRKLLSYLSRIFDPLGLLAPIVIVAKCLLQKLWLQPLGWDSLLDSTIQQDYAEYRTITNEHLPKIRIPRHVDTSPRVTFTIHGFCDASELAYACCVYLNVIFDSGSSASHLLCAKTRVAPIHAVSIPRLELCGASLLARTMTKMSITYACPTEQRFAYSDSTIVLAWLSKPCKTWKTFVCNRVSDITSMLPNSQWRHVKSQHNSADIASCGTTAENLATCKLWWSPPLPPPVSLLQPETAESQLVRKEERTVKTVSLTATLTNSILHTMCTKYSSHLKMVRVYARVQYAADCFKAGGKSARIPIHSLPYAAKLDLVTPINAAYFNKSLACLIGYVQEVSYPDTFRRLREKRPLKRKDSLRSLSPYIDPEGLLRIRGRISNANLPLDTTNPILLPAHSMFTTALIRHTHRANLHGGPKLIISILRQKYWIVNIRDTVSRLTRRCVLCRRLNGAPATQPSGDLPADRITQSRPFSISGVDYGGPILVRYSLARKSTTTKAYIALFVCFATKAIHLELVSDLTSDAFLAALERFISRRGLPLRIYSDNGKNFVGANRKMNELAAFLERNTNHTLEYLASKNIEWHFIPPYAPNFGGLWEAGMKSAKKLLVSSMQSKLLTFEEVATILAQAEACLNSRPLTSLTSEPNASALTPGHFLIGDSLHASPSMVASDNISLAKRWKMVQETAKSFWGRWHQEYLTELHQRATTSNPSELTIGEVVLLKDDDAPPLTWPMGRLEALHPGRDGITRVATIHTKQGSVKRAVSKIVRLLVDSP